ncbi:MAG: hypothetical protein WC935_01640 [Thermoleophilia bacterium]
MSNANLWALIVGFFAPLAVAWVTRAYWAWQAKLFVAGMISAAIGVGTSYFAGQFVDVDIGRAILLAIIATIGAYETTWKDTSLLNYFLYQRNGGAVDQISTDLRL